LGTVLGDLSTLGYDAEWGVISAADVGANHLRERIWIVAKSTEQSRLFSHTEHNRARWGKQQSKSIKEKNVANSNGFNDAMRGNGQNNEKSMVRWGNEFGRSVSNSGSGCEKSTGKSADVANTSQVRPCGKETNRKLARNFRFTIGSLDTNWWEREPESTPRTIEPRLGRVANGVANRVDRLKAIGNGQVSQVARTAWNVLKGRLDERV
jgi:DNA (cytosine-5)-methyltransferase 1